ncbi:hypothetical protein NGA_0406900 [Nannochloropsis gaditana CCMP526]|uniref:uncharacterized protein n=1 Tax=Nannochloropsis gaditana (strain CCMP526) TaxID=1093141 RepID=UPI00029F5C89|nr:hypothetical protein NGA_0406900 [Nannochloropsis gaditana CCMP526]EKU21283.1 hypothetical protein NGA_0406900 [Nannochloropsis gaditana CCMP526]|eukprot:XP_005855076.1 hypothetical protein NGA_0406900 [Nannochloropsis gaditana CCMP526]
MKAAKAPFNFGGQKGSKGSDIAALESALQQLLLRATDARPTATAPLPSASFLPRSMLRTLLSSGLDAAAPESVRLLSYRVLAEGRGIARQGGAAPEAIESLKAVVLRELQTDMQEEGQDRGVDEGGGEDVFAQVDADTDNVRIWALRALLNNATDAHLLLFLRCGNLEGQVTVPVFSSDGVSLLSTVLLRTESAGKTRPS